MSKFYFDEESADRAVSFIEGYITHVKGEFAAKPLVLEKWQKDEIIKPLFGWKQKDTDLRKYRTCYVEIPRKNGKSSLAAAIALYILFADSERGAEIYSCAGDRNQASIIFNIAKSMVENSQELTSRAEIFRSSIVNPNKGNTYKALSSEAKLQHGHNAHAILFDELHTQPNRELWEIMKTATGARTQPLLIALTTAGASKTDGNICWEVHSYALKVKKGIIEDEQFLPVIYCADEKDDFTSEDTWRKANPNYDISVKAEYIKAEAKLATELPSYENAFRRLHLNQWTTSETKWLSDTQWMASDKELDLESLKGRECYGGLDLASTRDLSALTLIFQMDDGTFQAIPIYWLPEMTAQERSKKDKVPYVQWAREGHIQLTEGDVQDYNFIRHKINELALVYRIKSIAFDRWNSSQLVNNLTEDGATMNPFGQGYASMSAPTKELEKLVLKKQIAHGNNPVFRWQIGNVQLRTDPAGNIIVAKDKSSEKVDGVVSLVMALGEWMTNDTGLSVYENRGVVGL